MKNSEMAGAVKARAEERDQLLLKISDNYETIRKMDMIVAKTYEDLDKARAANITKTAQVEAWREAAEATGMLVEWLDDDDCEGETSRALALIRKAQDLDSAVETKGGSNE